MVKNMKNNIQDIFAKMDKSSQENFQTEKYLTLYTAGQLFAIRSSNVVEIVRIQPITFLPKLPPYVKGVINLRGKIVPLIDLRLKLGKPEIPYTDQTSIVVVQTEEMSIGLIVDGVDDVTDISQNQINETPTLGRDTENGFVTGIVTLEKGAAMLLDLPKILKEDADSARDAGKEKDEKKERAELPENRESKKEA